MLDLDIHVVFIVLVNRRIGPYTNPIVRLDRVVDSVAYMSRVESRGSRKTLAYMCIFGFLVSDLPPPTIRVR